MRNAAHRSHDAEREGAGWFCGWLAVRWIGLEIGGLDGLSDGVETGCGAHGVGLWFALLWTLRLGLRVTQQRTAPNFQRVADFLFGV